MPDHLTHYRTPCVFVGRPGWSSEDRIRLSDSIAVRPGVTRISEADGGYGCYIYFDREAITPAELDRLLEEHQRTESSRRPGHISAA
jgi:hypothetical protein